MLPSILALLGNIYHSDLPVARASTQQQQSPAQPRLLYRKTCTQELLTVMDNLMTPELISSPGGFFFELGTSEKG